MYMTGSFLLILYSELAAVADQGSSDGQDPILTDIYHQFLETLEKFKNSAKVSANNSNINDP